MPRKKVTTFKTLSEDMAAMLLAEAFIFGNRRACENAGVHRNTLCRYKKLFHDGDPVLVRLVAEKKALLNSQWAVDLTPAIRGAIDAIRETQQKLSRTDPAALHALVGSLKILSETAQAERILDMRIAAMTGATRPQVIEAKSSTDTPQTPTTN